MNQFNDSGTEDNEDASGAGDPTMTGGNMEAATTVTAEEEDGTEEKKLDSFQKSMLSAYCKRELFGKTFPVINEDSLDQHQYLLKNAMTFMKLPQEQLLQFKKDMIKHLSTNLNNNRSTVKKKAKKLFKGE